MTTQLRAAREAFAGAKSHDARLRCAQDLSDALAGRLLDEPAFAFARECIVRGSKSPWAASLMCELQLGELLNNAIAPALFPLRRAHHGTMPTPRLHTTLRRLLEGGPGLRAHEAPWLIHGLLYTLYDHDPVATESEAVGLAVLCRASARRRLPTELLAIAAQYALPSPQPLALLCLSHRQVNGHAGTNPHSLPRPLSNAIYAPDVALARWAEEEVASPKRRRTE